jgi:hypothetical protein
MLTEKERKTERKRHRNRLIEREKAADCGSVVECLPSKCKALSSDPSNPLPKKKKKKKKKQKQRKRERWRQ